MHRPLCRGRGCEEPDQPSDPCRTRDTCPGRSTPALTVPAGDQRVQTREHVYAKSSPAGQPAASAARAQHAPPQGRRRPRAHDSDVNADCRASAGRLGQPGLASPASASASASEGVGVGAGQLGGPGQGGRRRRGRARSSSRGARPPYPDPGEPGVVVVRVVPDRQPSAAHACTVSARVTSSSGRRNGPITGAHPGERAQTAPAGEPEQHRLRLVVAGVAEQHDRVLAGGGRAQRGVAARRGRPPRAHPPSPTLTRPRRTGANAARDAGGSSAAEPRSAATSADPGWRPWSMTTAPTCQPALAPSKAAAAARAIESGPPEQATRTRWSGARSARASRTPRRTAATAGSSGAFIDARGQPCTRVTQRAGSAISSRVGRFAGLRPHGVEPCHADLVEGAPHEDGTVAVLPELRIEAEQLADHLVEWAGTGATRVELGPDVLAPRRPRCGPTPSITTSA